MAIFLSSREFAAAIKREEREAKRRDREIQKRLKEQAKLDALERAKLEVEEFASRIEVLLSMHKQTTTNVDWEKCCAALAPVDPPKLRLHELRAVTSGGSPLDVARGRQKDQEEHQAAREQAAIYHGQIDKLKEIGKGVLAGEKGGYKRALSELGIFNEIGELGSQIHFTIHSASLIECELHVIGSGVIPAEVKALSAAGKVSTKAMPRGRFHEIYQDYVCGCLLRVANEVFALLPVEKILVTARSEIKDTSMGVTAKQPVLSVIFDRARFGQLQMETLDPSDAVQGFEHRGEFKKSSKAETFTVIEPLTSADCEDGAMFEEASVDELFEKAVCLKRDLQKGGGEKVGADLC